MSDQPAAQAFVEFDSGRRSLGARELVGYLAIGLVFFAFFGKDILAEYVLGFANRNFYGAIFLVLGCVLAFISIALNGRIGDLITAVTSPLIAGWIVLLLIIAPLTAYFHRGVIYISPQAAGFVAAIACFLVSPRIIKRVLAVLLAIQFLLLTIEYIVGFSFTLSLNESLGYSLPSNGWMIDFKANLVRAKGLVDSTHDSSWMFIYSSFIFDSSILMFVSLLPAAWMSLARLSIITAVVLTLLGPKPARTLGYVSLIALAVLIISPGKMLAGAKFFIGAFDLESTSNAYRMQATKNSLDYLSKQTERQNEVDQSNKSSPSVDLRRAEGLHTTTPQEKSKDPPNFSSLEQHRHNAPTTEAEQKGNDSGGRSQASPSRIEPAVRLFFGVSGISLVSGEVLTEMSYTLVLVEYGFLGLALLAWTIFKVAQRGYRERLRANMIFSAMMVVLLFSSAIQSSSTFFMFWFAVLYLSKLLPADEAEALA